MPSLLDQAAAFTPQNLQAAWRAMVEAGIFWLPTSVSPTNGTSGTYAGYAPVGTCLYGTGAQAGNWWTNVGTLASPTWAQELQAGVPIPGSFLSSSPTGGVGYSTGAGGTVIQATSKSTGVILNKVTGQITMNNAALAATTSVAFTLTNSAIAATDVVIVNFKSGNTANSYTVSVDAIAAGSCSISLRNYTAGSLSDAVVLQFAVIKGANA